MDCRALEVVVLVSCLVVLLATCTLPWKVVNGREREIVPLNNQFFLGANPARASCVDLGGNAGLASVQDATDVAQLIQNVRDMALADRPQRLYVARYRNSSNYYRPIWAEDGVTGFTVEPNNLAGFSCPTGFTEHDSACYSVSTTTGSNFNAANSACASASGGGRLASIETAAQWTGVTAGLSTSATYYIGAVYSGGAWAWTDGTTFVNSLIPEDGTATDGDCAFLTHNGTHWLMGSGNCGATDKGSICRAAANPDELCTVLESPSRDWANLTSDGGDVKFRHVRCCAPAEKIGGAYCEKYATAPSGDQVADFTTTNCMKDCGVGWVYHVGKCYKAVSIASLPASTYPEAGAYKAQKACHAADSTSNVASSISDLETHSLVSRLLYLADADMTSAKMVFLGYHDIDRAAYQDHAGAALPAYLTNINATDNMNVSVGSQYFIENCVVLNATAGGWTDPSQHVVEDVNCCEDMNMQWALCEKPVNGSALTLDAQTNVYAQECYSHIDECDSVTCQNGGTCQDKILGFECLCVLGYDSRGHSPALCQHDIDYCLGEGLVYGSPTCDQSGTLLSDPDHCVEWVDPSLNISTVNCTCKHWGYNGTRCEQLWNHCGSTPCQHGGTCTGDANGYSCVCPTGTTGASCETNIDDCSASETRGLQWTCSNGGTCVDELNAARCLCSDGYTGDRCTEVRCSSNQLPTRTNMEQLWDDVNVLLTEQSGNKLFRDNAVVRMRCNDGYKFSTNVREVNVTCGTTDWIYPPGYPESSFPQCEAHCEYIPNVQNAQIVGGSGNTLVSSTVNFECNTGHRFPDNSSTWSVTCQAGASSSLPWSMWTTPYADVPSCEILHCPVLPTHPHQTMDTQNRTYATIVTFWCDIGYDLFDGTTARSISCLEDGQWSTALPPCNPVTCADHPIALLAGLSRNTSEVVFNTYIKWECATGQRMRDGSTYKIAKCDANKEWSDTPTECGFDRCYPLPYVVNASANTDNATCNQVVTLTCDSGHQFFDTNALGQTIGNGRDYSDMTCDCGTSKHLWRPLTLRNCQPVLCPEFLTPLNVVRSTDVTLYGTLLALTCIKGHYYDIVTLHNAVYTECLASASWNITDADVTDCWPVQCRNPPTGRNVTRTFKGSLTLPAVFNYTESIRYECDAETKLFDGQTVKDVHCDENGDFSLDNVNCLKERCDPVPERANTVPNTTDTDWLTTVLYECKTGFEWGVPESQLNAGTKYKIKCEVVNNLGGRWSSTSIPGCVPKKCPILSPPTNSVSNVTNVAIFDTIKALTCNKGYTFEYYGKIAEMYQRCNEQGFWEWITDGFDLDPKYPVPAEHLSDPHVCVIVECPKDPYSWLRHEQSGARLAYEPWFESYPWKWGSVENATISNNTYRYDQVATYSCIDGYQYSNKDLVRSFKCLENGSWAFVPPDPFRNEQYLDLNTYICEVKFCPPVPEWAYNITYTNESNSNEFESVITYECKEDTIFKDCTGTQSAEFVCETPRRAKCLETKAWEPPFVDCRASVQIGSALVGFRAEAPQSVPVGIFGCALLACLGGAILILDSQKLYADIKMMKGNIESMMKKKNKVSDSTAGLQGAEESSA